MITGLFTAKITPDLARGIQNGGLSPATGRNTLCIKLLVPDNKWWVFVNYLLDCCILFKTFTNYLKIIDQLFVIRLAYIYTHLNKVVWSQLFFFMTIESFSHLSYEHYYSKQINEYFILYMYMYKKNKYFIYLRLCRWFIYHKEYAIIVFHTCISLMMIYDWLTPYHGYF